MRVTAELFVAALVRRANDAGAFAVVARKGSPEAGAVHVVVDDRSGETAHYAPAIAGFARDEEADRDDRRFSFVARAPANEIDRRLASEASFDPDFWVVEIDDREGRHFLGDAVVEE